MQYASLWKFPIEREKEFLVSATMGKILNNFISVKYICKQSLDDLRRDLEQISTRIQCIQEQRQSPSLPSVFESRNSDGSSESNYFSTSATLCPNNLDTNLSSEMESFLDVSLKVQSDLQKELSNNSPTRSESTDVQELLELFKSNENNTEIGISRATKAKELGYSLSNKPSPTNPFSPDFAQNR